MKLEGIMPALHTSYDADGEVTDAGLKDQLEFLMDAGCSGFFVGGSTGEGVLQTVAERTRYLEWVTDAVAGRAHVMAHVGALATRDACELARRARAMGVDSIGSVLPIYFPIAPDGTVDYYRAIGEAGDGLPLLVYYLLPASTATFSASIFADMLDKLPQVFALKYTSCELETFGQVVDLCGDRLSPIMGADQLLLPALTFGASGAIGTTYNFMPELATGTFRRFHEGDLAGARELMWRLFRVIHLLKRKYGPVILDASRAIMRMRGMETGHPRAPLARMTEEQEKQLRRDLDEMDFFTAPIG